MIMISRCISHGYFDKNDVKNQFPMVILLGIDISHAKNKKFEIFYLINHHFWAIS